MLTIRNSRLCIPVVVLLWLGFAAAGSAQEENETNVSGLPLENAVTGRDLAFRFRGEVQVTDDSSDLLESDPAYKIFPSQMYAAELKASQADKLSLATSYEMWDNPQDYGSAIWGWSILAPASETQRFVLKYKRWQLDDSPNRDYYYAGINGYLGKFYSYALYRYATEAGNNARGEHQVSEYLSWAPGPRFRVGTQFAVSMSELSNTDPWFARLFSTITLVENSTSLRLEYQHYKYVTDLSFDEYRAYLYQKVGAQSLIRIGTRYYQDSNSRTSLAPDIKLKHYFSPRFSAHVGYRYYMQDEDADLNTYLAGVGIIF